jgi:predicted nucleotidyltransferase
VIQVRELAASLGLISEGAEWYLFGSVDRDEEDARDIDLLVVCKDSVQADALRVAIDPDQLELPLHLAFMTYAEEAEVSAVQMQHGQMIFP